MGLPLWSSLGFGNDEDKTTSKAELTAPRRSPIQRSFPTRDAALVDPQTGHVRHFRRPTRRRPIPPQVPIPQSQPDSYLPTVRSPLVPSIGSLGNLIQRAQRVLGHAHVAMDRLLARQYIPHLVGVSGPDNADRARTLALTDELDVLLRSAREFSENTRAQITYLIRWERNLIRGDVRDPDITLEFHEELETLIEECEVAKRTITSRLEQFQSWATDAREGIAASRAPAPPQAARNTTTRPRSAPRVSLNEPQALRRATEAPEQSQFAALGPPMFPSRPSYMPRSPADISVDGLGDRSRSGTPDNDADAWDTMRLTLEPDQRLPSTDSSFTSAAASASFSAPSNRSGSTGPLSAASSRTDLSLPPYDDEDCGPLDGSDEGSGVPEVLPSPLFRDMSGRIGRHGSIRPRNGPPYAPMQQNRALPALYGEQPARATAPIASFTTDRGQPGHLHIPEVPLHDGLQAYSFSARRSHSPLSFLPDGRRSTEPASASQTGPQASTPIVGSALVNAALARNNSFDGDVSNVMRLAFQYASAVASSSDPHTDPELEHMRQMFSTVANGDGQLNDDWWMSAGVAPYLADDTQPTDGPSSDST